METSKGSRNDSTLLLVSINSVGESTRLAANLKRVLKKVGNRPLSVITIIGFSNQGPTNLFTQVQQFLEESSGIDRKPSDGKSLTKNDESSPPNQLEVWISSQPFLQTINGKEAAIILLHTKCSVEDFEKQFNILSSFMELNLHASSTTVIYHPEMISENIYQEFGACINKCMPVVENNDIKPSFQKLALLIEVSKNEAAKGSPNSQIVANKRLPQEATNIWSSIAKNFESFDYHFIPKEGPLTKNNNDSNMYLESFISNLIFNLQIRKANEIELNSDALRMIFKTYASEKSGKVCPKTEATASNPQSKVHQGTQKNTASIQTILLKQVEEISEREQTGLAGSRPTPILTLPITQKQTVPKFKSTKKSSDSVNSDDQASSPKPKSTATRQEGDEQSDIDSGLSGLSLRKALFPKPLRNSKAGFSSEDDDDDSQGTGVKTIHHQFKSKLANKWTSPPTENESEQVTSTKKKPFKAPDKTRKWGKSNSESDSGNESKKSIPKSCFNPKKPTSALPPKKTNQCSSSGDDLDSTNSSVNKWLSSSINKVTLNKPEVGKTNYKNCVGDSSSDEIGSKNSSVNKLLSSSTKETIHKNVAVEKISHKDYASDSSSDEIGSKNSSVTKWLSSSTNEVTLENSVVGKATFTGISAIKKSTHITDSDDSDNEQMSPIQPHVTSLGTQKPFVNTKQATFLGKSKVPLNLNKMGAMSGESQPQSTSLPLGFESSDDETDMSFTKLASGPSRRNLKYSKTMPVGGSSSSRKDFTDPNVNTESTNSKYAEYFSQRIKKDKPRNESSESD